MTRKTTLILAFVFISQTLAAQDRLMEIISGELERNMSTLSGQPDPAYYINYRVHDTEMYNIQSSFGNVVYSSPRRYRMFNTMVRVGSHELDNTHEVRTDGFGGGGFGGRGSVQLPLEDDPLSIRTAIWANTDQQYKDAVKQLQAVRANVAVAVEAEDKSDDFSKEKSETYFEKPLDFEKMLPNIKQWEARLNKISGVLGENKDILNCSVHFSVELTRKYFVDTDGARIAENAYGYRVAMSASATAADGMDLPLYQSYFAFDLKELPSESRMMEDARQMSRMISALRAAPVAESYSGPALMTAKASGVFFHEIFGHRVEGARMKRETDAQTFKKKVGDMVLPADFSVIFDPSIDEYKGIVLSGGYSFDDEGVRGQRVEVVRDGRLESFLMSRTPIDGFPRSNGHGRGVIYASPVSRQSNMIIETTSHKSEKELREMLMEEARSTGKEYGYMFDEVAGGFTTTGRYMPNAFNVTPLVVYRVYVDGRPDELVRGVDLVGTPLSMFAHITACGGDIDVFNGYCGAESGSVPVSTVSPSVFVKMIETQKKAKSQSQPPILERP